MDHPTQKMGASELRSEDNVIFMTWNGELDIEHTRELLLCIEHVESMHEHVFIIVDARAAKKMHPNARKLAITWKLPRELAGVVVFGASMTSSILLNVLTKALRLVQGIMTPVELVGTEEAARAWVDAQQRSYQDA
jgi:hypothetical protein